MKTMEKIYGLVNRENGLTARCSEKHLVEWVARGFEVESFVYDELPQNNITTNVPHLSSNNIEYFSSLNRPKKK
jgi:hypothetical protein